MNEIMNEIICPYCKKAFKADEAGFADILKQVHDHEFEKELHERVEMLEKDKENFIVSQLSKRLSNIILPSNLI